MLYSSSVAWSLNASTSPATDPLFQTFTIAGKGNLSITESCPHQDSWVSTVWTISPLTKLELPITCRITSEKFNCSAMSLKSNETKKNIFPNLRMAILEQHWEKEETNQLEPTIETRKNQPLPIPTPDQSTHLNMHLLCAGGVFFLMSLTVIGIKLAAIIITLAANRAAGEVRINHSVTPSAPAAPNNLLPRPLSRDSPRHTQAQQHSGIPPTAGDDRH